MKTSELETGEKEKLAELIARISAQNIISMEVVTDPGSYLEGMSWELLKYVYDREKDRSRWPGWFDYEKVYQDSVSPDSLLSDFDDLKKRGYGGLRAAVIITYREK